MTRKWPGPPFSACFTIFLLRPHHRRFNKRLVKTPKLYFCDLLKTVSTASKKIAVMQGAPAEFGQSQGPE